MHLQAKVARTSIYVYNRISHSALGFKTPEEMFTGKKFKVSHLNIFGCPVFVHLPKERRTKLYPFRKKGIFGIVRSLRPSKYIYQVSIILKSVRM